MWFALSCLGFSQSQPPRRMPSGHFICMAHKSTEDTTLVVGMCWRRGSLRMSGVPRGGLGGSNPGRSGSCRISGRDLAAEAARVSPKTPEGTERQLARGATHSVVWRTGAPKVAEHITYVERYGTRHTLRTAIFREREGSGACRVANGSLSFCELWKSNTKH